MKMSVVTRQPWGFGSDQAKPLWDRAIGSKGTCFPRLIRPFHLQKGPDRHQAWMGWLFEARKRFHLCVLNYMVTSNHIHLLVYDREGRNVIPDSMQLVAVLSGSH